jgi:hypothetical protein
MAKNNSASNDNEFDKWLNEFERLAESGKPSKRSYVNSKDKVLAMIGRIPDEILPGQYISLSVRAYGSSDPKVSFDKQDVEGNNIGKLFRRMTPNEVVALSSLIEENKGVILSFNNYKPEHIIDEIKKEDSEE